MGGTDLLVNVALVVVGALLGAIFGPLVQSAYVRLFTPRHQLDITIEEIPLHSASDPYCKFGVRIENSGGAVEDDIQVSVKFDVWNEASLQVERKVIQLSHPGIQLTWTNQTSENKFERGRWNSQGLGFAVDRLRPKDSLDVQYKTFEENPWEIDVAVSSAAGRWHADWRSHGQRKRRPTWDEARDDPTLLPTLQRLSRESRSKTTHGR